MEALSFLMVSKRCVHLSDVDRVFDNEVRGNSFYVIMNQNVCLIDHSFFYKTMEVKSGKRADNFSKKTFYPPNILCSKTDLTFIITLLIRLNYVFIISAMQKSKVEVDLSQFQKVKMLPWGESLAEGDSKSNYFNFHTKF